MIVSPDKIKQRLLVCVLFSAILVIVVVSIRSPSKRRESKDVKSTERASNMSEPATPGTAGAERGRASSEMSNRGGDQRDDGETGGLLDKLRLASNDGLPPGHRRIYSMGPPNFRVPDVWPPPSKIAPPRGETFADDVDWPQSLEEGMTPELRAVLDRLHPIAEGGTDYLLKIHVALAACIGDSVAIKKGELKRVDVLLHFTGEMFGNEFIGTDYDVTHSQLSEEEDKIVLDCLTQAHHGAVLRWNNEKNENRGTQFHLPMGITFPLGMSYPYRAIREGRLDVW